MKAEEGKPSCFQASSSFIFHPYFRRHHTRNLLTCQVDTAVFAATENPERATSEGGKEARPPVVIPQSAPRTPQD
jgi:hypothetical protein